MLLGTFSRRTADTLCTFIIRKYIWKNENQFVTNKLFITLSIIMEPVCTFRFIFLHRKAKNQYCISS